MFDYNFKSHEYLVSSTDYSVKEKLFWTRSEAESYMHKECDRLGLEHPICIERDRHERLYENNQGIQFCINRI